MFSRIVVEQVRIYSNWAAAMHDPGARFAQKNCAAHRSTCHGICRELEVGCDTQLKSVMDWV